MKHILITIALLAAVATAPAAPHSSVSQYGITWTFDTEYECGQFVNGDWWVIGPVTVTAVENDVTTPGYSVNTAGRTMNGSMVNPSANTSGAKQGYDSHGKNAGSTYDSTLNVGLNLYTGAGNTLPLAVNSSLVSGISFETPDLWPQLRTAAILTVLATAPPTGSFRPGYAGTDKTVLFTKADLDYSILKTLPRPADTPLLGEITPLVQRPWLDHMTTTLSGRFQPAENMADYGRDICNAGGLCALALNFDWDGNNDSLKENLYTGFVQAGLDLYCNYQNGMDWLNDGGIWSGRKLPILLAGQALQAAHPEGGPGHAIAADMAGIGLRPDDDPHFQEDDQTFYVSAADVYDAPYELNVYHSTSTYNTGTVTISSTNLSVVQGNGTAWEDNGSTDYNRVVPGSYFAVHNDGEEMLVDAYAYRIDSVDYAGQRLFLNEPYRRTPGSGLSYETGDFLWYGHADAAKDRDNTEFTAEHIGLPEWGIRHASLPILDGLNFNRSYLTINGNSWLRMVMATRIMGLKEAWNHDPLFDWMDRYTTIRVYIDSLRLNEVNGAPLPGPPPGIDIDIPGIPPTPDPKYGLNTATWRFDGFDRALWDTYRDDYGPVWPDTATSAVRMPVNTDTHIALPLSGWYDLQGRRYHAMPQQPGVYLTEKNGRMVKRVIVP